MNKRHIQPVDASNTKPNLRIGVFGGTFDPIHLVHIAMARAALTHAKLHKVLFVVSARPPHKQEGPVASPEERLEMVRIALSDEPYMEPCDIELTRPGLSYTIDTLRDLRKQYPTSELFLILGMDSICDFKKWHEPEKILELAHVLAIPRATFTPPTTLLGKSYEIIPFPKTTLSSTEVREKLKNQEDVSNLLHPKVLDYIHQRGIYEIHQK